MKWTLITTLLPFAATLATAAAGPGLANLTYPQSALFKSLYTFHPVSTADPSNKKGMNAVAMHKGYLFSIYAEDSGSPGGGIAFYDISDPRNVKLIHSQDVPDLRESHGFGFHSYGGKDYAALQSIYGVHIWDFTDVTKPVLVKDFRIEGVSASDYDEGAWWVHWQAPYIFVARGMHGFSIVDASDPANPKLVDIMVDGEPRPRFPISKTGGFKLGPIFPVGNLLVATNMGTDNNPGFSTIDISDPTNPRLLDADNSTSCYSTFFNGNRLYCAGASSDAGLLVVHDMSDPTDIRKVGQSLRAGGRGEYVSVQDGYAHMGVEDKYAKIDLNDFRIVDNSFQFEGQEGFANVLGNLVLVTDDHSIGSDLVPHQAEPDRNPPKVNMVSPKEGAVNQKLTSRIGLTFTDQIDVQSLGITTFIIRPYGGSALPGRYSSQTNIVNFTPMLPLAANTTYEVVVPSGGIKDYAGNPTGEQFLARFSTGAAINAPPLGIRDRLLPAAFEAMAGHEGFTFRIPKGNPGASSTLTLSNPQGVIFRTLAFRGEGHEQTLKWDGLTVGSGKVQPGLVIATLRSGSTVSSRSLILP